MATFYYTAVESRSHAFLLERRLKAEGVICDLSYMPRELMTDLCNLGVKFREGEFYKAIEVIYRSGLPGIRMYREIVEPDGFIYEVIDI